MMYFWIGSSVVLLGMLVSVIFYYRYKERNLLDRLNQMLDQVMDGTFTETLYDESVLSALETRLNQYLLASTVSAKNLGAEKAHIKQLIADISHQTKTPIANILLYTQLLEEQELPEESRACLRALSEQTDKLSFLVGSLIKTSRLEAGVVAVRPSVNKVSSLLDAVKGQIEPRAKEKQIQLTLEETQAEAIFDEKWTIEALYNIVDNAIKYTPEGGKVSIRVIPYSLFCKITIQDTGIGIEEADHAKIFTRFYRAEKVAQIEGVGIGLFLAREIISRQGGYIKVESVPQGGSLFSVCLPMAS